MAARRKLLTLGGLMVILAAAVFFRFAYLGSTPPGLYPDEAVNGVDALKVLESDSPTGGPPAGGFKVFYPDNNGREGLFINLQSVALSVFGNKVWVLRAVSGVFGILAVAGLFFLARLLWNTKVALLSSYFMAVGFWAVNFSRIGFRAIMLPAILVWAFYFLWLGLKRQKSWPIVIGGLVFGLGFHSYISFRIAPILALLLLAGLWFHRTYPRPQLWRWAGLFFLGAVITASPLLLYYAQNPSDFIGRAAQVSIFKESSPAAALGGAVVKTFGMFNFAGDYNWRHNFAGRPLLYWPIGIAFLAGLIIVVGQLRKKYATKDHFLLAWFLVMLIPNFLAPEGAPHALRALGAQPAVYIISALGFWTIYKYFQTRLDRAMIITQGQQALRRLGRLKLEVAALALVTLVFVGVWEARTYFVRWAPHPETRNAFSARLTEAAEFLKINSAGSKYFIVNEGGVLVDGLHIPAMSAKFILWNEKDEIGFINGEDIDALPARLSDAVLVFAQPDESLLNALQRRYPGASPLRNPFVSGLRIK